MKSYDHFDVFVNHLLVNLPNSNISAMSEQSHLSPPLMSINQYSGKLNVSCSRTLHWDYGSNSGPLDLESVLYTTTPLSFPDLVLYLIRHIKGTFCGELRSRTIT